MIKYIDTQIVFREFPDEVTLAINLTQCPNHCVGCHSPYLREDIGFELNEKTLDALVSKNNGISCVGFMGGDNDTDTIIKLGQYVKDKWCLKTGWYSGKDILPETPHDWYKSFDYIKLGHWDDVFGPLDSKTTNQKLYAYSEFFSEVSTPGKCWRDITYKFWNKVNKQ